MFDPRAYEEMMLSKTNEVLLEELLTNAVGARDYWIFDNVKDLVDCEDKLEILKRIVLGRLNWWKPTLG